MNSELPLSDLHERSPRAYNSVLRKKQAEATRQLILEALAEQIATDGLQDFAIADAAERAGVSPRTIYRYFPNREAMLTALGEWVERQLTDIPYPTTAADIVSITKQAFPTFDQQAALVKALLQSEIGQQVRFPLRMKRQQAVADSLTPYLSALDSTDAKSVCAVIQFLGSANMWSVLREDYGLNGHESAKAVAWTLQTLLAELDRIKHQGAEIETNKMGER